MKNKKLKAYIRLTLTFTLILSIIAATVFAVSVSLMDGKFFGYTFDSSKSETHLDALLLGVESRTSSPVRIPRDPDTLEHLQVPGLYPCGEGAGYAGGIVSSALDGINCAAKI